MSSVRSFKSQNVTKRIVTTTSTQLFVENDFAQLDLPNTKKYVSKLGNSYIIAAGTKLSDVLDGTLPGNTIITLNTSTGTIAAGALRILTLAAGATDPTVGQVVSGPNIVNYPATTVFGVSSGVVTLSADATGASSGAVYTFSAGVPNKPDRFRVGTRVVDTNTACLDMGKEIRIGYAKEPDALVFRKVRVPPNPTSIVATDLPQHLAYPIGYILVDNKVDSDLSAGPISTNLTYGYYFDVTAARV
jgi:hypothetical protein